MPKYLIQASYTSEGVKGLQSAGGSSRRDAVGAALESVGGQSRGLLLRLRRERRLRARETFRTTISAAAVAISVNAAGGAVTRTTVLLTPEEVDAAAQKSVGYRPPGG